MEIKEILESLDAARMCYAGGKTSDGDMIIENLSTKTSRGQAKEHLEKMKEAVLHIRQAEIDASANSMGINDMKKGLSDQFMLGGVLVGIVLLLVLGIYGMNKGISMGKNQGKLEAQVAILINQEKEQRKEIVNLKLLNADRLFRLKDLEDVVLNGETVLVGKKGK